jgi:hypothetical protein
VEAARAARRGRFMSGRGRMDIASHNPASAVPLSMTQINRNVISILISNFEKN